MWHISISFLPAFISFAIQVSEMPAILSPAGGWGPPRMYPITPLEQLIHNQGFLNLNISSYWHCTRALLKKSSLLSPLQIFAFWALAISPFPKSHFFESLRSQRTDFLISISPKAGVIWVCYRANSRAYKNKHIVHFCYPEMLSNKTSVNKYIHGNSF